MATRRILGAFRNSPYKALELETAIPPPGIRFEKACNRYSLRFLQFLDNHPVRQACYSLVQDELGGYEDLATLQYLQSDTQLTSLIGRLQGFTGRHWKIERPSTHWEKPWAAEPAATIGITKSSKEIAKEEHYTLLYSVLKDLNWVFYTDGSQGKVDGIISNSAALCRLDNDFQTPIAKYWNLGPAVEVADAELAAITEVLKTVLASPNTPGNYYIFSNSQAAILKLHKYSFLA